MTFLLQLREAARQCSKIEYRALLVSAADMVEAKLSLLHRDPTEQKMQALNGAWAYADRIYKNRPSEGTPSPLAGSPEPALLAA